MIARLPHRSPARPCLPTDAQALHRLCDRRPRPAADDTRTLHLARQLFERLARVQANAARLLGPPRADDTVDIDADHEPEE